MNNNKKRIKELERLSKAIRDVCYFGSPNYDEFLARLFRDLPLEELRKFVDESLQSINGVREATELDYAAVKRDRQVIDRLIFQGVKPTAFTIRCALNGSVMLENLKEKLKNEQEFLKSVSSTHLDMSQYEDHVKKLISNTCKNIRSVI